MEKHEVHAVIKYLYLKGMTTDDSDTRFFFILWIKETSAESAPAFSTVAMCTRGRSSCDDLHQCGRPASDFRQWRNCL